MKRRAPAFLAASLCAFCGLFGARAALADTPVATPSASPASAAQSSESFVAGDYVFTPRVYNEFSPGNTGDGSYSARGAWEFRAGTVPVALSGDLAQYQYPHHCTSATDPQCYVEARGGVGTTFVPAFTARDWDSDVQFGARIAQPRIYAGVAFRFSWNSYGYPFMSGIGFGAEKLPDLDQPISAYGSAWYYPFVEGMYTATSHARYRFAYHVLKYKLGLTYRIRQSPIFVDAGWLGDDGTTASSNDPSPYSYNGLYVGLGVKF